MIGRTYIVGIGHKARQGKDTFARALLGALVRDPEMRDAERIDARIMGVADDLKAFCRVAHGMRRKDPKLLIHEGAAWARATRNERFWLDRLIWRIEEDQPRVAIVPDVRFAAECEVCDVSVKVTRYEPDGSVYRAADRPAGDRTETALDGYGGWRYEISAVSGDTAPLVWQAECLAGLIVQHAL